MFKKTMLAACAVLLSLGLSAAHAQDRDRDNDPRYFWDEPTASYILHIRNDQGVWVPAPPDVVRAVEAAEDAERDRNRPSDPEPAVTPPPVVTGPPEAPASAADPAATPVPASGPAQISMSVAEAEAYVQALLAASLAGESAARIVYSPRDPADGDDASRLFWDEATGSFVEMELNSQGVYAPLGSETFVATSSAIPREYIDYTGPYGPNTIYVNTTERRLYYIYEEGKAIRYAVGVGREGFEWSGADVITRTAQWPTWTPPASMVARDPNAAVWAGGMPGGLGNPLGARALYIGYTLYRVHGTNDPASIGLAMSSGCIRMLNEDIVHLYNMVGVGTRVVVNAG